MICYLTLAAIHGRASRRHANAHIHPHTHTIASGLTQKDLWKNITHSIIHKFIHFQSNVIETTKKTKSVASYDCYYCYYDFKIFLIQAVCECVFFYFFPSTFVVFFFSYGRCCRHRQNQLAINILLYTLYQM